MRWFGGNDDVSCALFDCESTFLCWPVPIMSLNHVIASNPLTFCVFLHGLLQEVTFDSMSTPKILSLAASFAPPKMNVPRANATRSIIFGMFSGFLVLLFISHVTFSFLCFHSTLAVNFLSNFLSQSSSSHGIPLLSLCTFPCMHSN